MKIVKTSLCISMIALTVTLHNGNEVFAVNCADSPSPPPSTFSLGDQYFIYSDSSGNELTDQYFTDMVIDIDPAQGVPANYVYQGMELAVFNKTTNSYTNFIGSVKESCMKADLGNPKNYDTNSFYEIRYRVKYRVLGDDIQDVQSGWRTVPSGSGIFFRISIPLPMDPAANVNLNKSWVESKTNASYVNDDYSGIVRTLILTDKSAELVDIKSEGWYASKIDRQITSSFGNYSPETITANPTYMTPLTRSDTLLTNAGPNLLTHNIVMKLYGSKDLINPIVTRNQTLQTTIIRDIFNTMFDFGVSPSRTGYHVSLKPKDNLSSSDMDLLSNSFTYFGLDLTKPYAALTGEGSPYIEDYADKTQVSWNTAVPFSSNVSNPIFRIGYLGVGDKKGYTFSFPMTDLLAPRILGITDGQTLSTVKSSYTPSVEVRGKSNIFRFPSQPTFSWPSYESEGIKLDMYIKKVNAGDTLPADLKSLFDTEPLLSATSESNNTINGASLTESGNYVIGLRASNKFGETAYDIKQFNLMLNGDTKFLTVTNNASFEVDEKSIRYSDYKTVDHGMSLIVDGKLSVKTAFNLSKQLIFLGTDSGVGPVAKIYTTDLAEYAAVDLTGLGFSKIYYASPYLEGFLIGGEGSNGLVYLNATSGTITPITGVGNNVTSVLMDGQTLYVADGTNLYAGRLEGTEYKIVSTLPLSTIFNGASNAVRTMSKISNSLYLTPFTSGGTTTNVVIVSIE